VIPAFYAQDDCNDPVIYSYEVAGANAGGGLSNNASGTFSIGTSTITWTASDEWGNTSSCTTIISINDIPSVSIPDAYALNPGGEVNTVYVGYAPASSIRLTSVAGPGSTIIAYEWRDGSKVVSNSATAVVSPVVATTYTLTVTNIYGCQASVSRTINVVDVRAGLKADKVLVCHKPNAQANTLEIAREAVAAHLAHGDKLGGCQPGSVIAGVYKSSGAGYAISEDLTIMAYPNPTLTCFQIDLEGGNESEKTTFKVTNVLGKVIEHRDDLKANQRFTVGADYSSGVYFIEIRQGIKRTLLKLIKQ
jgi:hypothetical protein